MILVCSHWSERRAALEASILITLASRRGQGHAGPTFGKLGQVVAGPALMCASLPRRLGNEYREPVAVLTKRISSRAWDPTVTQDDVAGRGGRSRAARRSCG